MKRCLILIALLLVARTAAAQDWRPMGPPGGDVRALAADPRDPKKIYLGTSDGHIFGTSDAGDHWVLLGRAGAAQDGVVTAMVVDLRDSARLYAALWAREDSRRGGIFRSDDGGHTWRAAGLAGQSVRALVQSASHPEVIVAGTLLGIFRARVSHPGATPEWERISPEGHEELRNLDSLALDPQNPETIYAGTYHLPWKTTDGGKRWSPIHSGMIDDSDVMAIVPDRNNSRRLYASACSGIYRSDNAGALWRKIQGIPFSARRTHVIVQDPLRPETIYAGTTEGLWKTPDAGASWKRITPATWVINAMTLEPGFPRRQPRRQGSGRIVLGTEQLGVMVSADDGSSFHAANLGFNHRQIVALALDPDRTGRLLAVLANAPEPVLATDDGGRNWSPLGPGLNLLTLRRAYASPSGWLAAMGRGGLMRYDAARSVWLPAGMAVGEAAATTDRRGRRLVPKGPRPLTAVVLDMAFSRDAWFAATAGGLLASRDSGETWQLYPVGPMTTLGVRSVRVSPDGSDLRIVSLRGMVFSRDAGRTWSWHDLPYGAGAAERLEIADENTLLATTHRGLFISRDAGKTWQFTSNGLPEAPVQDLAAVGDLFIASMQTRGVYLSTDAGRLWERVGGSLADGDFPVIVASTARSTIFAASASDGVYAIQTQLGRPAAPGNGEARHLRP